jgi:hypothetical protein
MNEEQRLASGYVFTSASMKEALKFSMKGHYSAPHEGTLKAARRLFQEGLKGDYTTPDIEGVDNSKYRLLAEALRGVNRKIRTRKQLDDKLRELGAALNGAWEGGRFLITAENASALIRMFDYIERTGKVE